MSHDIISDALNNIMNAKRVNKKLVVVKRSSKLLIKVLEMAKSEYYIKDYKKTKDGLEITFGEFNKCSSIKPRYNIKKDQIEEHMKQYLPARGIGMIIISTSKGLMTHGEAIEKNMGGSLIAYFY